MADIPRGRFVWHELLTTDPAAARQFYPRVTGWTVQPFPTDVGMEYGVWMNGEKGVGGVAELPREARDMGAPPNWLGYISTPDVDATVAEARRRGATVFSTHELPSVGRWAILADPQRAVFAAMRPDGPDAGPLTPPGLGEFSWNELMADDHEAAFEFYSALFGWERIATHDMGPMGTYIIYGTEGVALGGMFRKPADMPAPPHWLYYIEVDSAEAAVGRIQDAGGQILNGPMEVPGGNHIAQCRDPQGAAFAVDAAAPAS